jgi:hypothetical protein
VRRDKPLPAPRGLDPPGTLYMYAEEVVPNRSLEPAGLAVVPLRK